MIDSLYLKHFKCFNENLIPLNGLTVLSGPNSAGKSTIIQALSSLMQTAVEARYSSYLTLNGSYVSLGTVNDVVNIHKKEGNIFSLGIEIQGEKVIWEFESDEGILSGARLKNVHTNPPATDIYEIIDPNNTFDCLTPQNLPQSRSVAQKLLNITHLTADRQAGHEIHHFVERRANATGCRRIDVGPRGEAVMTLLMTEGERILVESDPRCIPGTARSIIAQTSAWMNYLFPGASLDALPIESSSFSRLRFRTNVMDQFRRPESVGYGFAQVFPLVALGLAAGESNTVLIENPEVHLHPAAQSRLGRFLAKVAAVGVQVVVETHSDHIINGIRLEVADQNELASLITIYSIFNDPEEPGETHLEEITVDESGRLSSWPKGFFDQAVEDAKSIVLRNYSHD